MESTPKKNPIEGQSFPEQAASDERSHPYHYHLILNRQPGIPYTPWCFIEHQVGTESWASITSWGQKPNIEFGARIDFESEPLAVSAESLALRGFFEFPVRIIPNNEAWVYACLDKFHEWKLLDRQQQVNWKRAVHGCMVPIVITSKHLTLAKLHRAGLSEYELLCLRRLLSYLETYGWFVTELTAMAAPPGQFRSVESKAQVADIYVHWHDIGGQQEVSPSAFAYHPGLQISFHFRRCFAPSLEKIDLTWFHTTLRPFRPGIDYSSLRLAPPSHEQEYGEEDVMVDFLGLTPLLRPDPVQVFAARSMAFSTIQLASAMAACHLNGPRRPQDRSRPGPRAGAQGSARTPTARSGTAAAATAGPPQTSQEPARRALPSNSDPQTGTRGPRLPIQDRPGASRQKLENPLGDKLTGRDTGSLGAQVGSGSHSRSKAGREGPTGATASAIRRMSIDRRPDPAGEANTSNPGAPAKPHGNILPKAGTEGLKVTEASSSSTPSARDGPPDRPPSAKRTRSK